MVEGTRITVGVGRSLALGLGLACIFPLAFLALLSLAARWPAGEVWPRGLSAGRWIAVLAGRGQLGESLILSAALSLSVAAVATVAGYLTSRAVAYSPHRNTLLLLAYVPFAFSPVVLGTCLLYLYIRLGLAGTAVGVAVAQVTFAYGFAVVFFVDFWTPRQRAYEELVYTLGGSPWAALRRALLPLSRGMLLVCFFQTFLISWFQYGLTLLVGAGKVKTLPLKVFDYLREANVFYAALAGCLLALPPCLLTLVNKRFVAEVEARRTEGNG